MYLWHLSKKLGVEGEGRVGGGHALGWEATGCRRWRGREIMCVNVRTSHLMQFWCGNVHIDDIYVESCLRHVTNKRTMLKDFIQERRENSLF